MKSLTNFLLEGVGHAKMRLGSGSSGTTYDMGDGFVRKTLRIVIPGKPSARRKEREIIDKWFKCKKDLKVIPHIKDWDGDGYTVKKFETPCQEGLLIERVLWKCLFSPSRKDWDERKINKAIGLVGKEEAEWVMSWLDDFVDDYHTITGETKISDDIRTANIGKDEDGNIVCFDWYDAFA